MEQASGSGGKGEADGERGREEALKSRKGFGYDVRKASIRLSNTAVSGIPKPS